MSWNITATGAAEDVYRTIRGSVHIPELVKDAALAAHQVLKKDGPRTLITHGHIDEKGGGNIEISIRTT